MPDPQVYDAKRRALAWEMAQASKDLIDALEKLELLGATVQQSGGGFEDSDFPADGDMAYLNAWVPNNLRTVVVPGLRAALGNTLPATSVTYQDILLAMRPGP